MFVFEDTEATAGGPDTQQRAEAFLAGPLSAFVDQVDAPTLVAAQTHLIADSPAFARLAPTLARLEIPLIADHAREVVDAILARRLAHADAPIAVTDVFHPRELDMLAAFYTTTRGDLRRVLAATYEATEHAAIDTADAVGEPHMRLGVAQWQPAT